MSEKKYDDSRSWKGMFWESHHYNERTKIKSGTYLHSYCPFCKQELTAGNILSLKAVDEDGQKGTIELSPYLNSFERKTDLMLKEGQELSDLLCPHCQQSLKVEGKKCGLGDSHVAHFLISVSNTKVPFYICMRTGCTWHGIDPEDEKQIILDGSDEW